MPQVLMRGTGELHGMVDWPEQDLADTALTAKAAANGLVAVHFPLRFMEGHGTSPNAALLLGLRDSKVRIVDIKISTNPSWTEANREHYESLGPHRDPLLYLWKELMGQLPPPGSAFALPPPSPTPEWASRDAFRMDLPVVPGAPLDEHAMALSRTDPPSLS